MAVRPADTAPNRLDRRSEPRIAEDRALGIVFARDNLMRSVPIALVVGTVLFAINQADIAFRGQATSATWVKSGITYIVPFVVSNLGILHAHRSMHRVGSGHQPPTEQSGDHALR